METHAPKKRIYYDGTCRVCTAGVDVYTDNRYERHDVTKHDLPQGVSYTDAMHDMHVIETDGTVHRGADAVFSVMDDHAILRWVAKVGRLPGIHALAHGLYRIVATHRYLLNRKG